MSQQPTPDTANTPVTPTAEASAAAHPSVDAAPPTDAETDAAERPRRPGITVAAFVVTVLAWVSLPLYYPGALGGGILALVLSILALRQPRGAWRNLALVATVASSVLLLLLAIFWTALLLALKYL